MNAKEELLEKFEEVGKTKRDIKCAVIKHSGNILWGEDAKEYFIRVRHSHHDQDVFIDSLDFDYDANYGGQELDGCIWLKDGTWFERDEYDGSEWWVYKKTPEIPDALKRKGNNK